MSERDDDLADDLIDELANEFERELRARGKPSVRAYLERVEERDRLGLYRELVLLELEYALRGGESASVATYLSHYPELAAERRTVAELIALEYRVGRDCRRGAPLSDYLKRFAEYRDDVLARLAELGEAPPRVEGYEVVDEVGQGGMGIVYRAIDEEFGRAVAVKLLRPAQLHGSARVRLFLDEARITGRLQHPGVPPVYRLGTLADGQPYLAMKLIEGRTLAQLMAEEEPEGKDRSRFVPIFEKVCQTVAYAHEQGVVHRDLKPSNVMVGAFGEVQVMDWGLAKELREGDMATGTDARAGGVVKGSRMEEGRETVEGLILGTPAYMAPEQARGEQRRVDMRADVYALGAMLCEILTGHAPHGETRDMEESVRLSQWQTARARIDECGGDKDLTALAKHCLEWTAEDRPANAAAIAERLGRYREEVAARVRTAERESAAAEARSQEERKRRRVTLFAASVSIGILSAGIVGTAIGFFRADKAREAEAQRADGEARALVEVEKQRVRAEWERDRAQRASDTAFDALDAMTSELTGNILAAQVELSPQQKHFLKTVLPAYRKLAQETGSDEKARVRAARTAFRVGLIEYRLGRMDEALRAWEDTATQIAALRLEDPKNIEHGRLLAAAHSGVGMAHDGLGNALETEKAWRTALAIREQLVRERKDTAQLDHELAWAYNNLCGFVNDRGRHAEAVDLCRKCLELREKLARSFPKARPYQTDLAIALRLRALLYIDEKKNREAVGTLMRAIGIWNQLLKLSPQVPEFRDSLADNLGSLALLRRETGEMVNAKLLHERELTIRKALHQQYPSDPKYLSALGIAHSNFGNYFEEQENLSEAILQHRASLEYREKLAARYKHMPVYRQQLARTHMNLGRVYLEDGKAKEAEKHATASYALRKALLDLDPKAMSYRKEWAWSALALGAMCEKLERVKEAEAHYREAKAIFEALTRDHGDYAEHQSLLAAALENLGSLLGKTGRRAEAEEELLAAWKLRDEARKREPGTSETGVRLAGVCNRLGKLALKGESPADAQDWFNKAVETATAVRKAYPKHLEVMSRLLDSYTGRAESRLRMGQVKEAVADLDSIEPAFVKKGKKWFEIGCLYARAAEMAADAGNQDVYARRALDRLGQAAKAGFSDATAWGCEDLAFLRSRAEYREALEALAKKK